MNPSQSYLRMRLQSMAACVGGLVLWWRFGGAAFAVLEGLLLIAALLAWVLPERYRPLQRVLDLFANGLVVGVSWLLLGLVYFGIFTPLKWLCVLAGRDPLRARRRPVEGSYLVPLASSPSERYKRQY